MGRKKVDLYRIYDESTGLYYNGGQTQSKRNPNYDSKVTFKGDWNQKPDDYHHGKHPWNYWYKEYWDTTGKIFTNYRGAEQAVSRLSKTSKRIRKNKAENILFGNQKSNNIKILRCRIVNINDKKVDK